VTLGSSSIARPLGAPICGLARNGSLTSRARRPMQRRSIMTSRRQSDPQFGSVAFLRPREASGTVTWRERSQRRRCANERWN
jgi:hypothetical protein